nr:ribonuclease III [Flavobacterium sp.]
QKEKRQFHYDIYEDNGIDGERLFGVKLSIDEKVVAKARATSKKKAEEKASQRAYFAFQEKIDKK